MIKKLVVGTVSTAVLASTLLASGNAAKASEFDDFTFDAFDPTKVEITDQDGNSHMDEPLPEPAKPEQPQDQTKTEEPITPQDQPTQPQQPEQPADEQGGTGGSEQGVNPGDQTKPAPQPNKPEQPNNPVDEQGGTGGSEQGVVTPEQPINPEQPGKVDEKGNQGGSEQGVVTPEQPQNKPAQPQQPGKIDEQGETGGSEQGVNPGNNGGKDQNAQQDNQGGSEQGVVTPHNKHTGQNGQGGYEQGIVKPGNTGNEMIDRQKDANAPTVDKKELEKQQQKGSVEKETPGQDKSKSTNHHAHQATAQQPAKVATTNAVVQPKADAAQENMHKQAKELPSTGKTNENDSFIAGSIVAALGAFLSILGLSRFRKSNQK